MNKAYISAISYYLPEYVLDNNELNALFPEWSADKISSKTGIYKRHIAASDEFSSDMAIKAAENLFLEHNLDRKIIDYIILCTQSPDYHLPTTACILQDKLGISTSCGALDINLGCSGYIYGLSLAKGLISANIASNVLLITSETYSKYIQYSDKSNRTIFGDGASATLINSIKGFCEIGDFVLGTDGSGKDNLIVKNGGSKHLNSSFAAVEPLEDESIIRDDYLFMNGSEIFNFTAKAVPDMINKILSKNGLLLSDINLFIFHQANEFMLNFIRKKIGIPEEKFFLFLENCGNTVSSTVPIALYEAIKSKKTNNGDLMILAGFGVGYSWGSVLVQF